MSLSEKHLLKKGTYIFNIVCSKLAEEFKKLDILESPFSPQILFHKSQEALIELRWTDWILIAKVVATGGFGDNADFLLLLHPILHFLELSTGREPCRCGNASEASTRVSADTCSDARRLCHFTGSLGNL